MQSIEQLITFNFCFPWQASTLSPLPPPPNRLLTWALPDAMFAIAWMPRRRLSLSVCRQIPWQQRRSHCRHHCHLWINSSFIHLESPMITPIFTFPNQCLFWCAEIHRFDQSQIWRRTAIVVRRSRRMWTLDTLWPAGQPSPTAAFEFAWANICCNIRATADVARAVHQQCAPERNSPLLLLLKMRIINGRME